jgi:hypothetical protein
MRERSRPSKLWTQAVHFERERGFTMQTQVRVRDLQDQTGYNGPRSILRCSCCGAEYSANKGDYFAASPDHVFMCCDFPMARVVKSTVYKHVDNRHV